MSVSADTVAGLDRKELIEAYKQLDGRGYDSRWSDELLARKVDALLKDEPPVETPIDFDDPEVAEYLIIHEVATVPRKGDRAPMAVGMGFLPGSINGKGKLSYALDQGSRWLSILFLSQGLLREPEQTDAYWLSVRNTVHRYGVPQIGPGVVAEYRMGGPPALDDEGCAVAGEVSVKDRRLLRAALDMTWATLSTGFHYRSRWNRHLEEFVSYVTDDDGDEFRIRKRYRKWERNFRKENNREPSEQERTARCFLFGGDMASDDSGIHHKNWFPVPLMAFPESARSGLFDDCTLQRLGNGERSRAMPGDVINLFTSQIDRGSDGKGRLFVTAPCEGRVVDVGVFKQTTLVTLVTTYGQRRTLRLSDRVNLEVGPDDDVVLGEVMGHEVIANVPAGWSNYSPLRKAQCLWRSMRSAIIERFVEDWFDWQCLDVVRGFVHVPMVLGQFAARKSCSDKLMWDLRPCMNYYEPEYDGFCFPTFNEREIGNTLFSVRTTCNQLTVDLLPQDPRYQCKPCSWYYAAAPKKERNNEVDREITNYADARVAARRRQDREFDWRSAAAMERFRHEPSVPEKVPETTPSVRPPVIKTTLRMHRENWEGWPFRDAVIIVEEPPEGLGDIPGKEELTRQLEQLHKVIEAETFDERMKRVWGNRWPVK